MLKDGLMTLIIFNQCSNGQIVILDRKETNISNVGQITKKYFLSKNQQFILALAGESLRIDTIFSALTRDSIIDSKDVISKLDGIIENSPIFGSGLAESSGLLLSREKNSFLFYNVWFTNSQRSIVEENPPFKCNGCIDVCPTNCLKQVPLSMLNLDLGEGNLRRAVDNFYDIDSSSMNAENLDIIGTAMLKDEDLCIRCGLCAEKCPTQAVTMDVMNYSYRWIG